MNKSIKASNLALEIKLERFGQDHDISCVSQKNNAREGSLIFSKDNNFSGKNVTVICNNVGTEFKNNYSFILSDNPRLDFIRAVSFLEQEIGFSTWKETTFVHPSVTIGPNVTLEDGCVIGNNTVIEANSVIHRGTRIGKGSRIRTNSSIGGDGFGFEREPNGELVRFPHLGGVLIGNNVEIGSLNSLACGTLSDTIIGDGVKTDNLVHIAHNCIIGENTVITACSELSGGVLTGRNVWIGPNSSILQKVKLGENSIVGIGSVVTKDVEPDFFVVGNPARKVLSRN